MDKYRCWDCGKLCETGVCVSCAAKREIQERPKKRKDAVQTLLADEEFCEKLVFEFLGDGATHSDEIEKMKTALRKAAGMEGE